MKKSLIIEIIIVLYAILFLYTATSKLIGYSEFKEQLSLSKLLHPLAKVLVIILPLTEFLAVLLLLIPRWRLKGFIISLGLMISFTIYIIGILLFEKEYPCSCGGLVAELSWPQHIILNIAFIILAVIGIILSKKQTIQNYEKIALLNN